MRTIRATARRELRAPADLVYTMLADYQTEHPWILPPAFSNVRVEAGGVGHGTIVSVDLTVGWRRRALRQRVEEPEPGRTLTETDLETGATTTFNVTPTATGSRVEITTAYAGRGGIMGFLEHLLAPRLLGRVYDDQLTLLAAYA